MIITFCGHSDYSESDFKKEALINILQNNISYNEKVEFFLGGIGNFDKFALQCAIEFKRKHHNCKLIYVTPYLKKEYFSLTKNFYDEIIFPEIENTPFRFRISRRNEWMVKQADLVIAYITHSWGGAAKTLEFAVKMKKNIINLAKLN